MRKEIFVLLCSTILMVSLCGISHSAVTITAEPGAVYYIYNIDTWAKNDNDIIAPNWSKAAVDPTQKTIRLRAYASVGIPVINPNRQEANGILSANILVKPGPSLKNERRSFVKAVVTVHGSYFGLIGPLGIAAGRVLIKGFCKPLDASTQLYPAEACEISVLDTSAGGIPTGTTSDTFTKGEGVFLHAPDAGKWYQAGLEGLVAAGSFTSGKGGVGVCDNDFYEYERKIKLDWIKIEIIKTVSMRGAGSNPQIRPQ